MSKKCFDLFELLSYDDIIEIEMILKKTRISSYTNKLWWERVRLYFKAMRYRRKGLKCNTIAKMLGLSPATVYKWDKAHTPLNARKIPKITAEFAELFTASLGDGHIRLTKKLIRHGGVGIDFRLRDEDLAKHLYNLALKTVGNAWYYCKDGWHHIGFYNSIIAELVEAAKVDHLIALKLVAPFPREALRGFFDTEGGPTFRGDGQLVFSNTNPEIVMLVKQLLKTIKLDFLIIPERREGIIRSPTNEKTYRIKQPVIYRIYISAWHWLRFYNEIGFATQRKQQKLKQLVSNEKYRVRYFMEFLEEICRSPKTVIDFFRSFFKYRGTYSEKDRSIIISFADPIKAEAISRMLTILGIEHKTKVGIKYKKYPQKTLTAIYIKGDGLVKFKRMVMSQIPRKRRPRIKH